MRGFRFWFSLPYFFLKIIWDLGHAAEFVIEVQKLIIVCSNRWLDMQDNLIAAATRWQSVQCLRSGTVFTDLNMAAIVRYR